MRPAMLRNIKEACFVKRVCKYRTFALVVLETSRMSIRIEVGGGVQKYTEERDV
jgi:hypothetical protein